MSKVKNICVKGQKYLCQRSKIFVSKVKNIWLLLTSTNSLLTFTDSLLTSTDSLLTSTDSLLASTDSLLTLYLLSTDSLLDWSTALEVSEQLKTAGNIQSYMSDGWIGWIYPRPLLQLEHCSESGANKIQVDQN